MSPKPAVEGAGTMQEVRAGLCGDSLRRRPSASGVCVFLRRAYCKFLVASVRNSAGNHRSSHPYCRRLHSQIIVQARAYRPRTTGGDHAAESDLAGRPRRESSGLNNDLTVDGADNTDDWIGGFRRISHGRLSRNLQYARRRKTQTRTHYGRLRSDHHQGRHETSGMVPAPSTAGFGAQCTLPD